MIQTLVLNRESKVFSRAPAISDLAGLRDATSNLLWVDVSDPTSQDFDDIAREFSLHPLAIEDCRHRHQRPKVEEYTGYYFIVVYEVSVSAEQPLVLRELNIFLGKDFLITVHSEAISAVATAERLWRGWADLADRGTGLLAYLLIDAIVDDYMPLLDTISDHLDELEVQIFEELRPESLREIFLIKKQLLFLRRAVTPLRDVFNTLLRREQQVFSRETTVYFQDVFDHLIRVADTIDTLRDLLGSTMDAYLSIAGNRMNMVMKRLTAISTLLMSVTLIAGIYGMNFTYMPELGMRFGYIGSLLLMLGVALALYLYFRRIKWL